MVHFFHEAVWLWTMQFVFCVELKLQDFTKHIAVCDKEYSLICKICYSFIFINLIFELNKW